MTNPSSHDIVARLRAFAVWPSQTSMLLHASEAVALLAHINAATKDLGDRLIEIGELTDQVRRQSKRADAAEAALREVQEGHPGFRCQEIARAYFDRTTPEGDGNG